MDEPNKTLRQFSSSESVLFSLQGPAGLNGRPGQSGSRGQKVSTRLVFLSFDLSWYEDEAKYYHWWETIQNKETMIRRRGFTISLNMKFEESNWHRNLPKWLIDIAHSSHNLLRVAFRYIFPSLIDPYSYAITLRLCLNSGSEWRKWKARSKWSRRKHGETHNY